MKLFSKIATAFVGIAMAIGVGVAVASGGKEASPASAASDTLAMSALSSSDSNISAVAEKSTGSNVPITATVNSEAGVRLYANNTLTISSSQNITSLTIPWYKNGSKTFASVSVESGGGTYTHASSSGNSGTWTGSSNEIVLKVGSSGQIQLNAVNYTISGSSVTYTITYDANGGTGTMSDTTNTVAACTFTAPEGKTFSTWNTNASGTGTDYAPGASATSDLDLYAIWVDKPACVTLDKIGTDLGSTANTTMTTVDIVDGSDTYTLNYLQCKKQGDSMFMTKSVNPFISNHTEMPGAITSVEVFINSGASGSTTYDVAFGTTEYTTATAGIGAVNITGGNSHVFENESVTDALYFCITLGNANNGQVLKIVVNYEAVLPELDILDYQDLELPHTMYVGTTSRIFKAIDKDSRETVSGDLTWTVGDNTVISITSSSQYYCRVSALKVGSTTLTVSKDGYKAATGTVNVIEDPTQQTLSVYEYDGSSATNPADGTTVLWSSGSGTYRYVAVDEDGNIVTTANWVSSDTTVATVASSAGVASVTTLKPGEYSLTASSSGFNSGSAGITVSKSYVEEVVVGGVMTKTTYTTSESWSSDGLTATANYHSGWVEDITSQVEWTFSPSSPVAGTTSVIPYANFEEEAYAGSSQSVTVTRINGIEQLYSKAKGATTGEFYGYYVGFATGSGPILMDGAYGIMLFNSSQDVSTWTENETIIHVQSGTIDIYNGLYEVKSYTLETVSSADVATPIVHTTTGSETATDANRLTNATGKVAASPTKGNFTDPAGTSDIQFTYTVGSNTFSVFYKKAAQTDEVIAVLKDSLDNSTEITIKGFTSWYNNFQVTMTGIVEAVVTYTAEDFSQDLLDRTDTVCEGYDGKTNNHDEIEAIWSNLASNDKYPSLPADQKTILAEAARDESGTVVEQAMARYDYLTGKYGLSNFINGRTPVAFAAQPIVSNNNINNSMSIVVVAVIAITSVSAIGVLLVIKRRKSI